VLIEPTVSRLRDMKLDAMAAAWQEQGKSAKLGELSFDERLGLLVDAEWSARESRRLERGLREAKLKISGACLEDVDYPPRRELEKSLVRELQTCRWIEEHLNVLVSGATGVGKTYLACALGHQALRRGFRVIYRRATRLFDELHLARADGSSARLLLKLARADVLILDDFALTPLRETDREHLLEVMEDRVGTRSTVLTSQLPPSKWHEYLGEPTIADAICDRLVHRSHKVVLKGPSRRKEAE
jgi:DNA replication protein DnaC